MEQLNRSIVLHAGDAVVNEMLQTLGPSNAEYSCHYSHTEDFFIRIPEPITVGAISIHHEISQVQPDSRYIEVVLRYLEQCARICPGVFSGLYYFFDPAEVLRPIFCRLYVAGERQYLYLMRPDLSFRPRYHRIIESGTNDTTPVYSTNVLFLDCDLIPVAGISEDEGRLQSVQVRQSVSQTWIGETGRGYVVQGIWLDRDLTRFFSKLFVPPGVRTYPYYPVTCRYRAISHTIVKFEKADREQVPSLLREAEQHLEPHLPKIQEALKQNEFSEKLPVFQEIKSQMPEFNHALWSDVKITAYLNEQDMKEFRVE